MKNVMSGMVITIFMLAILSGCGIGEGNGTKDGAADSLSASTDSLSTADSLMQEFAFYTDDSENRIYTEAEVPAEFPGGEEALSAFIASEVSYPEKSRESGSEGTVLVGFVVNEDGTVTNVNVVKPTADELLNAEAARIVRNMPAWTPGKINEEGVKIRYILPVAFSLNK